MTAASEKDAATSVELVVQSSAGEVFGSVCLGASKQTALVGRSDPCDMQVRNTKISGKHLEISWHNGHCELTVLGAAGCFWNDNFLEKDAKVWLEDKDVLVLAKKNKQDPTQAKEVLLRLQFCIRKGADEAKKIERESSGASAGSNQDAPWRSKKAEAKAEAKAPETVRTSYIDSQLKQTLEEIKVTEEKLQLADNEEKSRKTEEGAPKNTAKVPEPAAAPLTPGGAPAVPAPSTPPQWKPQDSNASEGDWKNWNSWRPRASRWDWGPEDAAAAWGKGGGANLPGGRPRSRTPAREDNRDRGRSRTPARGNDGTQGMAAQTPRRPCRGRSPTPYHAGLQGTPSRFRERSSTPGAMPAAFRGGGRQWSQWSQGPEVCPAPLFGRLVDSMAKVMGVQHAALQAFKTMPIVEVANVLISEVEQPKSTGICAPEAAKKWQKSRGALELEMAEMDLDDDVQRMLMELPDHEVRSAIQRARNTAQFPSRWLKGYVKRYWEQESRGEMRGPEVQVDPDLEELLRELPAHEARRALDKARNIADNPKAWLVGYCRRYWKEQQFHRNWT